MVAKWVDAEDGGGDITMVGELFFFIINSSKD